MRGFLVVLVVSLSGVACEDAPRGEPVSISAPSEKGAVAGAEVQKASKQVAPQKESPAVGGGVDAGVDVPVPVVELEVLESMVARDVQERKPVGVSDRFDPTAGTLWGYVVIKNLSLIHI